MKFDTPATTNPIDRLTIVGIDLRDPTQVVALTEEVASGGPLDILINNAGILRDGLLVRAVHDDGPAARAGIERGDLLVAMSSRPIARILKPRRML